MKLKNIYEQILKESEYTGELLFHGSPKQFNKFTDEFVGGKDATNQEGPGVYFSTNYDDVIKYAEPHGFVYKVQITPKKLLSNQNQSNLNYLTTQITKLIKTLPNWKAIANSYDDGLEELVYSLISMSRSEKQAFIKLYYKYFRGNEILFVRGMVKLGYDGLYLPSKDGGAHVVVYNPKIIKVISHQQL